MARVFLITGANRGIGLGLTRELLKTQRDVKIFAGARNPDSATELQALSEQYKGQVHIVKLVSGDEADAKAASELIKSEVGHVDVVIANAGILEAAGPVLTAKPADFQKHFDVNVLGPLVLYQQLRDVLARSSDPKFIAISTILSVMTEPLPEPMAVYGSSKAALNFVVQKIAQEEKTFTAICVHPGWVQTDMGNGAATVSGQKEAPVTVQDSVQGILRLVDQAKRETHNGVFWEYSGGKLPW